MSKKTLALIIGLIVLTVLLLIVALNQGTKTPSQNEQNQTENTQNVEPTPPAETTLILTPNPLVMPANGQGQVEVMINTNSNEVAAVQLEISYDPTKMTNVQLTPGGFLTDPIELFNELDEQTGRITYALGLTPAQNPVKGQGVIAVITFTQQPGASGQTQLELQPKSLVSMSGGKSVLKSATGTIIQLSAQSQPVSFPTSDTVTPTTQPVQ